jgi:hypothetical protein
MTVVFAPKNRKPTDQGKMGRDAGPDRRFPTEGTESQGGESEGGEQDMSHMDIHEVVKQHGPAHKMESEHEHEGGHHTVTTHHKGAKHHSEHGSAEEAHQHMGHALGMGSGADEQQPSDQQQTMDNSVPGY